MKSFSKVILAFVIIGGLLWGMFYLWENRFEYFFQGDEIETTEGEGSADDSNNQDNEEYLEEDNGNVDETESLEEDIEYEAPLISNGDCQGECENLKNRIKDYRYCREICGLNEVKNNEIESEDMDVANSKEDETIKNEKLEEGCEEIESVFQKDVCWKNKAVKEKNASYCANISEEQLSTVCENRVLEEIMD